MVDCVGRFLEPGDFVVEIQGQHDWVKIGVIVKFTGQRLRYVHLEKYPEGYLAKPKYIIKLSEQEALEMELSNGQNHGFQGR